MGELFVFICSFCLHRFVEKMSEAESKRPKG